MVTRLCEKLVAAKSISAQLTETLGCAQVNVSELQVTATLSKITTVIKNLSVKQGLH